MLSLAEQTPRKFKLAPSAGRRFGSKRLLSGTGGTVAPPPGALHTRRFNSLGVAPPQPFCAGALRHSVPSRGSSTLNHTGSPISSCSHPHDAQSNARGAARGLLRRSRCAEVPIRPHGLPPVPVARRRRRLPGNARPTPASRHRLRARLGPARASVMRVDAEFGRRDLRPIQVARMKKRTDISRIMPAIVPGSLGPRTAWC
jgi:hypothetical protein